MRTLRNRTTAGIAIVAAGALTVAACGTRDLPDARAQAFGSGAATGAAVSVACEPNQRAIVRPLVVNGVTTSQVECVSVAAAGYQPGSMVQSGAVPVSYTQPAFYGYPAQENARVVPVSYPAARSVAPRRALSSRAPVRYYEGSRRSVKKSALIIGGSAGAGAGIGAAIGGKKGALIGALLGGGGATVWDQITRHKQ